MNAQAERYVLVQAGEATWALPTKAVAEILPVAKFERPPGAPAALAGLINIGGAPLAVVRLSALFGAEDGAGSDLYRHIVRLAGGSGLGLLVDRVTDVDARPHGMAPLEADQSVNGAVLGNLLIGEAMVPLLDVGRLLLLEEQQRIEALAATARARLADLEQADA